jgi:hypothetical protein
MISTLPVNAHSLFKKQGETQSHYQNAPDENLTQSRKSLSAIAAITGNDM